MAFYEETGYEMECEKISGRQFESPEDHSEFMSRGGCEKLIAVLADQAISEGS